MPQGIFLHSYMQRCGPEQAMVLLLYDSLQHLLCADALPALRHPPPPHAQGKASPDNG